MTTILAAALASTISVAPISPHAVGADDGRCFWRCADAVFLTRGEDRRIVEKVIAAGDPKATVATARRFLVPIVVQNLQSAVKHCIDGEHVIATLRLDGDVRHAVIMVDANADRVTYWNPIGAAVQSMTAAEFRRRWVFGTLVYGKD